MNCPTSGVGTVRLLGLLSSLLGFWVPAHALVQGPPCDDPQSDELVLENRFTMLWIGGTPLPGGDADKGVFRMDAPDKLASYRFRSPANKTLSSVWIYFSEVTLPSGALVRLSVKDDVDGLPFPVGPVSTSNTFAPQVGWQEVSMPGSLLLQQCDVSHVVIEPETPDYFSVGQYVELTSAVSRYPIAYQPEDQSSSAHGPFYDLELSFMFQAPPLPLVTQWTANHYQYRPIFAIRCTDGTRFGQPYDTYDEFRTLGDKLWGQRIHIETTTDVNHVSVFVRGEDNGTDLLDAVLFDTTGSVQFSTTVIRTRPGVINRAHWFGGMFEAASLQPGDYYLMLRSGGTGTNVKGYLIPAARSSLPVTLGGEDGTFGSTGSYMVYSPDNGSTFLPQTGKPDMGILLGNLDSATINAFAIFDEGGVYDGNTEVLVAAPNAALDYKIEPRNIGTIARPILFDVVVESTGTVIGTGSAIVEPNRDLGGGGFSLDDKLIPASYTSGSLFRVRIRLGHTDFTTGLNTWDDEVRFEVRIL